MKSQVRLLEAVNAAERMARGRLCVLSRSKGGGAFYHLQYRKDTKLHQRYVSRDEAPAYERATESRELLLMIGKSINTALARTKDNTIGA